MPRSYEIGEEDRQLTLLALAHLSVERPGFANALLKIAVLLGGHEMFDRFQVLAATGHMHAFEEFFKRSHCFACGVVLNGGATVHGPDCGFAAIFKEALPDAETPPGVSTLV